MQKFTIKNLDCANCAARIEDALKKTDGVRFVSVDFATETLFLDASNFGHVQQVVRGVEPKVVIQSKEDKSNSEDGFNIWSKLIPILIAALLFFGGLLFSQFLQSTPWSFGYYLVFGVGYLISGWGVLSSAARNISRGQIFDENFLMSVATIGAIAIGEFPEAVGVMLFYRVGEFVQQLSVNRSRRSIQTLLEIRPDTARLLVDNEIREIAPSDVKVGEIILVKPGEKIPLDGEILRGTSHIDTSPLTGESVPRKAGPGDPVLAGSINKEERLTLKVTRSFGESSISRILELVESAASRKAATEKFITRFARVYSPIIVLIAIGVAVLPPVLFGANFSEWVYRALVVLVISCPCALVISIPLGYFGGVGGASMRGILVKGSNFLDTLAAVKTVVFDKTGTLTKGEFNVVKVLPRNGYERDELLQLAAQAEAGSDHPIALSIRKAFGNMDIKIPPKFREIAGHGVETIYDGQVLMAGNDQLLHAENIPHDLALCDVSGSVVHVVVDNIHAGCLVISDELKEDALIAIQSLRSTGVDRIVMLTGDNRATASDVADTLNLDEFRAELLPEDKVSSLEEILSTVQDGGKVAFVGDGINDAPALARADVGIAMGALGSDAAIETADVVVMTDSPLKVSEAIEVGRKTRQIVWQNIIFAFAVKLVFIILGIAGEASMWQAVFGDMGVALIAVFNATRVLNTKS